jgi:hypothetical protein
MDLENIIIFGANSYLAKKIIHTDLLLQKYSELEKEMSSLKNELINGKK